VFPLTKDASLRHVPRIPKRQYRSDHRPTASFNTQQPWSLLDEWEIKCLGKTPCYHIVTAVMANSDSKSIPPPVRAAVAAPERNKRKNAVRNTPSAPTTKRGKATRKRLKEAAILVLERHGYRNMRLQDVAEEADLNFSLFYHYFASKAELTYEILSEFVESFVAVDTHNVVRRDPFSAIYAANEIIANVYANSPGMMRCLVHFDEEESKFSDIFRTASLDWHTKIAKSMHKRFPEIPADEQTLLLVAYALGGMVDNFLFERFVDRNPVLVAAFPDPSSAARFLAIIWYRTVYLTNPESDQLGNFVNLELLSSGHKAKV
jgi:AcrR family transcriptional regulator